MNDSLSLLQALQEIRPEVAPVTIAGRTFYVRGMNGEERAEYAKRQAAAQRGDRPPTSDADIVALTLTDEAGNRLIANGDASVLNAVHGDALKRLALKALEISVLTDKAQEDAEKK